MNRSKLYVLLSSACMAGYIWILLLLNDNSLLNNKLDVCLFKKITHIPCPSCGTSHSVIFLIKGDLTTALYWNPMGLIVLAILVCSPFWITYDLLFRKKTLHDFYIYIESIFEQKAITTIAIILVLTNWAWNILKM